MDDDELLARAAKAAGIDLDSPDQDWWNPLTDSGDALDLAVKLGLTVNFYTGNVYGPDYGINRTHTIDRNNIRRAIVMAAAELASKD